LATVNGDINRNMDLIDFLRRLKMHGIALTAQLEVTERKFISNRAISNPVCEVDNFKPKTMWDKYEVMTQQDKIAVGLLKKVKRQLLKNIMKEPIP